VLSTIFLLKSKQSKDLDHLDIYSYPDDLNKKCPANFFKRLIEGHDEGCIPENDITYKKSKISDGSLTYHLDTPIPQFIDGLNTFTICINSKMMIGLIFEQDDNPYDYKEIFEDLSNELLNNEKVCSFEDEIDIENFLLTLFIDIRRYGDEILEKFPQVSFQQANLFTKAFLFGIDEVGKTSFVRRIKTGEFNENYFSPTRKFNIEYIMKNEMSFAFWDMPGQTSFRKKWLMGIQDSNIIVYMIDIANQLRFEEAKQELWKILENPEFSEIPLLILGNKIDLINLNNSHNEDQLQRTEREIFEFFDLDSIIHREWQFMFTSVKTNYNLEKAIQAVFNLIEL